MADNETPIFPAQAAAEEIERMARLYEPFVGIAAALRKVASLDNLIAERTSKADELTSVIAQRQADVEAAQRAADEANTAAENFVRQRNSEADAHLAEAGQRAQNIVDEANAQAERIVKDAQNRLNLLRDDIETAAKQRAAAIASNTQLELDHKALMQARENELAVLEGRIADVRGQITKLLGGV